mmetsp:Transcript_54385/g.140502  ORF Transcript_54385/g.140502 Transcript_54385/m.140502 type:complete len:229 (+) Transcript_54385:475-1161(+)
MIPYPLVGAPLFCVLATWLAAAVQRALVQAAIWDHRIEEHSVATRRRHIQATVAVLVVAIPRVVLFALAVERSGEEGLAALRNRLQVPEHCRKAIPGAVLDAPEHLRLAVIVVWVEEVAVGTVLLALGVPHHLDVLAVVVRQSRQVVCALLQRADLRRAITLHERLRRGAHVARVAGGVHHGEARGDHPTRRVVFDEHALRLGQEAVEHEDCWPQRHRRHFYDLVAAR